MEREYLTDETLVQAAREGDQAAQDLIFKRYKKYVKSKAQTYFIIGGDNDDIIQEGMIGLFNAIRYYDEGKYSSFRTFAEICITRQMITAVRTASRQKHSPLNLSISLNRTVPGGLSDNTLLDLLRSSPLGEPEALVIDKEDLDALEARFGNVLSKFEKNVFRMMISGKTYVEIADEMGRPKKSIDNAMQRIKRKLNDLR